MSSQKSSQTSYSENQELRQLDKLFFRKTQYMYYETFASFPLIDEYIWKSPFPTETHSSVGDSRQCNKKKNKSKFTNIVKLQISTLLEQCTT